MTLDLTKTKIQDRKTTLSILLAQEKIRVRWKPGLTTAAFDPKGRVVFMPIWKDVKPELVDMLCVHETGHALYTKVDLQAFAKRLSAETGCPMGVARKIHNVIEDVRINELQKRKYPGSRRDFTIGYQARYDRGDYGGDVEYINKLSFIDRINVHHKVGASLGVHFAKHEIDLMKRIGVVLTEEEVYKLSVETVYMLTQNKENPNPPEEEQESTEGSGEGDPKEGKGDSKGKPQKSKQKSDGDEDEDGNPGEPGDESEEGEDGEAGDSGDGDEEGESEGEGDGDGEGSEDESGADDGKGKGEGEDAEGKDADGDGSGKSESDSKENEGDGGKDDSGKGGKKGGQGPASKPSKADVAKALENFTVETATSEEDSLKKYIDSGAKQDYTPGTFRIEKVNPYKNTVAQIKATKTDCKTPFNQFVKKNRIAINSMVSLFEIRKAANSFKRATEAKTGVLNMNKVYNYKLVEDIFKKSSSTKEGKNHGFVYLLDTSGSMTNYMDRTLYQLAIMAMFARRINVPFEVYAFVSGSYGYEGNTAMVVETDLGLPQSFVLYNILSSKMTKDEFEMAMGYISMDQRKAVSGMYASGGTPLNSSLFAMRELVHEFLKKNPIDILNIVTVTDGEAGDSGFINSAENVFDQRTGKRYSTVNAKSDDTCTDLVLDMLRDNITYYHPGISTKFLNFNIQPGAARAPNKNRGTAKKRNKAYYWGYDEKYAVNPSYLGETKKLGRVSADPLEQMKRELDDAKKYKVFLKNFAETVAVTA